MPSYANERSAIERERGKCNECSDLESCQYSHKGYRRKHTEGGIIFEECELLRDWKIKRKRDNLYRASGLPMQYKGLTLRDASDYLHREVQEAPYIEEADAEARLMILTALGNEYIERGEAVEYISAPELLLQLRYNNIHCEERLKHYQEVPTLIIDDLGIERMSEYNEEQLYMVLRGREREGRRTLIGGEVRVKEMGYSERMRKLIVKWSG